MRNGIFINLNGWVFGLIFFGAVAVISFALFWGFAAVAQFLFPLVLALSVSSAGIFLFVVLPLSFSPVMRPRLIIASQILSGICGMSVWMYSFLVIVKAFGWFTVLLVFVFQTVAPLAAFILAFSGQWQECGLIILGLILTYGMRYYSLWLASRYIGKARERSEVIDIEAEVEEGDDE